MSATEPSRNHGPQPLDAIMLEHGLGNHDLVAASAEPMTHKAVQRARKGRELTAHMRLRMAAALNRALALRGKKPEREWRPGDLFNYTKATRTKITPAEADEGAGIHA